MNSTVKTAALAFSIVVSSTAASAATTDFGAFWSKFRTAVIAHDMTKVTALTKFPLSAGFDSDQDHPAKIGRTQFARYMATELKCESSDGGTTFDMIRSRVQPNGKYDVQDAHSATVGRFEFANSSTGWHLTSLNYGSTVEYQHRLRGTC
ncbi:hypothetical protein KZX46_16230 [Polymorphobacter sp. PAMC 29334]|uniref:hypothetical protein n=1 Tax=Polymorphobacter sp. PAMC 29334 TaxID=2862331 RepID=UPI001C797C3E|nr:hypothetical protein [Polymorphobacter sp. PAMC 29334]QYE34315.1 hypothetical protein KZX46_16230 [Polymorphobacter sp. PAMC 29334]